MEENETLTVDKLEHSWDKIYILALEAASGHSPRSKNTILREILDIAGKELRKST